jgi:HK97 family phage major capsid protein
MTLKELREKMANLLAQARSKFDEIKDDTPAERAAEIEREYDAIMADYDTVRGKAERLAALEAAEGRAENQLAEARENRLPGAPDPDRVADANGASNAREAISYNTVFRNALLSGAHALPADQREVFMRVQRGMGQAEASAIEQRAMSVGTPSEGGYFVPDDFSGELEQQLELWGNMYAGITRVINTSTGSKILWPTLNYTAQRGELHSENGAVTDDGSADPVIGQKELDGYIYNTPIVPVSIELLQDSEFAIEPLLAELFGESLGRTANDILTNGDGSGKPMGIVTGAGAGITAAATAALASDELIDMFHSVNKAYRQSPMCKWQMNDSTLATVRKLKDGNGNYLWEMGNIQTGAPDQLLGKPIEDNSAMDDIGAGNSPIIFGDHSRYVVRKIGNFSVVPFREKYMHKLQIGLMAFMRFDGEMLNSTAIKKLTMAAS